ncbi:MAG: hypothetical protein L3K10_00990 [Thermoplasmata archaeon]|nr:hypothetical protein [Thermoplasmata archaeon]
MKGWYDERALRSRLSADTYLRQLGGLCERLKLDPEELSKLATKDPDRLHDLLVKFAADLKSEERLDSYIAKVFDGLRSWLRARRVEFDQFPRLSPVRGVSLENEVVPSPDELRAVLYNSGMSFRGRSSALFMAHAGLRPGVLGTYQALDGLRLGDIPDLKLGKVPAFSELPFSIRVPARLSKTRKLYTTFGTTELGETFLAYLRERVERGEKLGADSPVIAANPLGMARGYAKDTGFLTTKGIVMELRETLKGRAPEGKRLRPYVLRCYASTRLLLAEASSKIPRDLRESILGHDTGGAAARYHVGKTWGPELLKEARASFKRAETFLTTNAVIESNEGGNRVLRALMVVKGMAPTDADKVDLGSMTDPEIQELFRKLGIGATTSKRSERAFPVDDVPKMLDAGWEFVAPLNGSMAVLRSP